MNNNVEKMSVEFESDSINESFARIVVSAFVTRLNPTIDEMEDIKMAVSEAVTNSIIHGYEKKQGTIKMECEIDGREIVIRIIDNGRGIENIEEAMKPLFTTKPDEERSGMGFSIMKVVMDDVSVVSDVSGTIVTLSKRIGECFGNEGECRRIVEGVWKTSNS